jgi:hypothetical protein
MELSFPSNIDYGIGEIITFLYYKNECLGKVTNKDYNEDGTVQITVQPLLH